MLVKFELEDSDGNILTENKWDMELDNPPSSIHRGFLIQKGMDGEYIVKSNKLFMKCIKSQGF